jgi:hypothetical protein
MGKGLSPLQRFILKETSKKGHIQNSDILINYYGFQPVYSGRKIRFSRKQIGMEKYISTSASVSNSLTRLRKRGLMVRSSYLWGHKLTKAGIQAVKKNKA